MRPRFGSNPNGTNSLNPSGDARGLASELVDTFVDRLVEGLLEQVERRAEQLAAERSGERAALDVRTAAARLGISQRGVERLVASGRLPSLQVGRRRLIPVQGISHLLAGDGDPEPLEDPRPRALRRRD
jgi:excisionase family DNA binding protein